MGFAAAWAGPEAGNGEKFSYGEAKRTVDGFGRKGCSISGSKLGRPVAILSGNSIEHALMTPSRDAGALSGQQPVSPAYSLMSQDHLKLKYLFQPDQACGCDGCRDGADLREGPEGRSTFAGVPPWVHGHSTLRGYQERVLWPISRRTAVTKAVERVHSRKITPDHRRKNCCSPPARPACQKPFIKQPRR